MLCNNRCVNLLYHGKLLLAMGSLQYVIVYHKCIQYYFLIFKDVISIFFYVLGLSRLEVSDPVACVVFL